MLLAPALLLSQAAPAPLAYLTPPKPILDAALTPWWTNVTPVQPSPDGTRAIVVDRDGPPPLAALARPYVNLAGQQVDTGALRERSLTTRSAKGLRIMDLATGALVSIDIPKGARVSPPKWSPDGRTLAFMVHTDEGSRLFVADAMTGRSKALGKRLLMPTLCPDLEWTAKGKALVAVFRPDGMKTAPAVPSVAPAPRLQISDAKRTSLRVYASTLKTPYDESLVDSSRTGQVATVGLDGAFHEIGKPMAVQSLSPSPDGRAYRVTLLQRPYSTLVPLSSFPQREVVVDPDGKELTELSKRGLRTDAPDEDGDEQGRPGGPNARRTYAWRPDGALAYVDGRDVKLWSIPYAKDAATTLYEAESPVSSVRFSPDGKTLFLTLTTGAGPGRGAGGRGIRLEVVKLPTAKRGFVLLPRRWVVERSFAWAARFRRLARDYERLAGSLAGYHVLAFALLMLVQAAPRLKSA